MTVLWDNIAYFLVALAVACAAFYFSAGRRGAPDLSAPGLKGGAPAGYYSLRSRLLASANGLAGFKNKIEKHLEPGFLRSKSFGAKDADAMLKICLDLEALLLELSRDSYPQPYLSQVEAARASGRELMLETVKLKSLIKGYGPDSVRVLRQLAKVEESSYRLQTHVKGL